MGTLFATYAVAWAAVAAYIARLAIENARLARRLQRLEEQADGTDARAKPKLAG